MMSATISYQPGLSPAIKIFLTVVAIIGPLAITGLIVFLKKIEKEDPERIRWR